MKKQLVISAMFDTSAFDKSISDMQRKLRDLNAPQNMVGNQAQQAARLNALGVGVSGPNQAAQERAQIEYRKNIDNYLKEEYKKNADVAKQLHDKKAALAELAKQQKAAIGDAEKELQVKKEIAKTEAEQRRLDIEYRQREANINDQADIKAKMLSRPTPMQQFGGRMAGMGATIGKIGGFVGAVGAAAERFTGYGQRLEEARGNAIEGSTGRDLASVYAGRSPFESMWMQERANAAGLAEQKSSRNRVTDFMKGVGAVGAIVGGAAMTIGTMGALGVPGTALMAGGTAALFNDRTRMGILGGKEYEQLLAAEQTKDFWSNLENFKKQDPKKRLAMEHFEQNFMKDLQTQRALGLSDEGLRGDQGFQRRGVNAGFTTEMMAGMGEAILGAGGSARMGQQAQFGLQMQRGGLTNASQILGSLSGSMQSPEASKAAVIGIMAEAFKKGLDTSNYVEETRRFTAAAADVISRTGAISPEAQAGLANTFGMFVGERTNAGIQNAKSAYEEFQQRGSELGGRRGVMRFSEAMRNENLSKLQPDELTALLSKTPEDLQSDPAALAYFADKAGYDSPADLMKDMNEIRKSTRFQIPSVRNKAAGFADTIAKYMNEQSMTETEFNERARQGESVNGIFGAGKGLPGDILRAVGGLDAMLGMEGKTLSPTEAASRRGEVLRDAGANVGDVDRGAAAAAITGDTGRIGDDTVGAIAKSADLVRTNFNELKTAITKAIDSTQQFADTTGAAASAQGQSGATRARGLPTGDPMQGSAKAATQGQAGSRPVK